MCVCVYIYKQKTLAKKDLTYLGVECHSEFHLDFYSSLAMENITVILMAWCSHHMKYQQVGMIYQ